MKRLVITCAVLIGFFIAFSVFEWRRILVALIITMVLLAIGIYDYFQTKHTLLRNFPILGHFRYLLEFIRPEIQQYFIATNQSDRPFDRETRSLVYQRAKHIRDTMPFGTQHDIDQPGYEYIHHSLAPTQFNEEQSRIWIGGEDCKKPYLASRLSISAMSFGALSKNAVLALNRGAKLGNFIHNTGEGGLSPYHLEGGGDLIWQLGTAYFGARTPEGHFDPVLFQEKAALDNVKMIELKLSQGAKPSEGGILPAAKVTAEIAEIRGIAAGKDCISPPTHEQCKTPIELLEFIARLRELSGGKPVGFKLCIGRRSNFFAICKAMLKTGILPDYISVDGAEGGTGAAPVEFSNHVGDPINDALIFVNNALTGINVRDKIRIIGSGKVASGFDMIVKTALGADICGSARAMLFSIGCIQSLQCNTNACPTGVTTQNPLLVRGLVVEAKYQRVANFHEATVKSFLDLAGAIGVKELRELSAKHIFSRTNFLQGKTYAQLYDIVRPGALLEGQIPEVYAESWETAKAESF